MIKEEIKKSPDVEPEEYYHYGGWNDKNTYPLDQSCGYLTVCGMITGCGIVQMSGVINIQKKYIDEAKEVLEKIKENLFKDAGAIICTLGHNYRKKHEPILFELGFETIAEYSNYRHNEDGLEKQKLYILKL